MLIDRRHSGDEVKDSGDAEKMQCIQLLPRAWTSSHTKFDRTIHKREHLSFFEHVERFYKLVESNYDSSICPPLRVSIIYFIQYNELHRTMATKKKQSNLSNSIFVCTMQPPQQN